LIDEELEWREPGTCRRIAEDTEPQRVDWNFLIVLPRICGAVLKDATLLVPGSCRHDFKIMERGVQCRSTLIART